MSFNYALLVEVVGVWVNFFGLLQPDFSSCNFLHLFAIFDLDLLYDSDLLALFIFNISYKSLLALAFFKHDLVLKLFLFKQRLLLSCLLSYGKFLLLQLILWSNDSVLISLLGFEYYTSKMLFFGLLLLSELLRDLMIWLDRIFNSVYALVVCRPCTMQRCVQLVLFLFKSIL